jgi:hypothetical protein
VGQPCSYAGIEMMLLEASGLMTASSRLKASGTWGAISRERSFVASEVLESVEIPECGSF